MKLILWDWNGTLLDDVDASIIALNILLSRRSMAGIDKPTYKRIFRFPVIENYRKLGFNLEVENFDDVAREYVAEYMNSSKDVGLFPSATSVLDYVHAKGYTQSIISAMPQSHLIGQIRAQKVFHYFQDIVGLQNIHATGKIESAKNYIGGRSLHGDDVFFIGDTFHDYEVAKTLGCKCILIGSGHQALDCAAIPDAVILSDISELCSHIL